MRIFFSLVFILLMFTQISIAQITICEKNTIMYFSCYKLNPDGTFSYQYIDGTSGLIGLGTYSFGKKEIVFRYDSLVSPIIDKSKEGTEMNRIKINCAYVLDSFPRIFHPVVYENNLFFCDSMGQVVVPNYTGGSILVHNYVDSILLFPKTDDCNYYHIYTHSPGNKFIPKGTVEVLKKKGKYYRKKVPYFFDKKGNPTVASKNWKYIYFNLHQL